MTAQEQRQQDGEGEVQVQESGPDGFEVFLPHLDSESGRLFGVLVGCLY